MPQVVPMRSFEPCPTSYLSSRTATTPSIGRHGRITAAALVTAALMMATVPSSWAGTAADPEITDATGDVDQFGGTSLLDDQALVDLVDQNAALYDIEAGYIAYETASTFSIVLKVVDIDGSLQYDPADDPAAQGVTNDDSDEDPVADTSSPDLVADFETRFAIGEAGYLVSATLDPFFDDDGQVTFTTNLSLHEDTAERAWYGDLLGGYDLDQDLLIVQVPKSLVGVDDTSTLTQFYTASIAKGIPMDYAPDADMPADLERLASEGVLAADAAYGRDYAFGQYARIIGGGTAPFGFSATSGSELTTSTGETGILLLEATNTGATALDLTIVSNGAGSAWGITITPTQFTLDPGSNKAIQVQATPTEDARSLSVLTVKATDATTGASRELSLTLRHADASGGTGGGDGDGGASGAGSAGASGAGGADGNGSGSVDDAPEQGLSDEESEDTPAPGLLATLVLLGLVAGSLRRPRDRDGTR